MRLVYSIVKNLAARLNNIIKPFDVNNFLKNKKGRIRRRYMNAYNRLIRDGLDLTRDSDIAAFVKLERYFEDGKSPRMIMGRNPKFNILYAQIIEPIEKAFFELEQVANACDYDKCGEKFTRLVGDWFAENDMSKYEASQRLFVLRLEHLLYSLVNTGSPEKIDLLDILFAFKIIKKGSTSVGVDFDFQECRGSGDLDTSLGNGLLNYISTQYFQIKNFCPQCEFEHCKNPQCKTYSFVLKGDDSYMSIPRFSKPVNTYAYFGFDAKLVIRKTPEDVEFCSGHFIEYAPGKYKYVQKLQKLIESLTTCLNADAIRCGWVAHYYKSLGLMYKQLYKGIPVYEDIADFLLKTNGKFGLNVNLVTSYNLLDAFNSFENKNKYIDLSLTTLSISLVNKMDYAELDRIIYWCKTSQLVFPPEMTKRCNTKTKPSEEPPIIDFGYLNTLVSTAKMPKRVRKYYKNLRSYRDNFINSAA